MSVGGSIGLGSPPEASAVDEVVPAVSGCRSEPPPCTLALVLALALAAAPLAPFLPFFLASLSSSLGSGHLNVQPDISTASVPIGAAAGSWKRPSSRVSG